MNLIKLILNTMKFRLFQKILILVVSNHLIIRSWDNEKNTEKFKREQKEFIKKLESVGYKNIKTGNPTRSIEDKELLIIK